MTKLSNSVDDAEVQAPPRGRVRRLLRHWIPITATAAALATAVLASILYFDQHRADQATEAAARAAVSAAAEGSVALLSYAPDSVDPDLAAAQSHLTGEFLTYYRDFANEIVAPAAKEKQVHAMATVVRSAAVDVDAVHAKVMIFLNQSTTSLENVEPIQTASSVLVGMTKVDNRWLISSFDPI